jgi:putative DNA methylase
MVCENYGIDTFDKLFTHRQLVTLTTFSQLVEEARHQILLDGGSAEYAKAVGVYLSFLVNKLADRNSSICQWMNGTSDIRPVFARQAIPMSWEIAEANPFSNSVGCWSNAIEWIDKCLRQLPTNQIGFADQCDSRMDSELRDVIVSTDPPYYDNISYADLSAFTMCGYGSRKKITSLRYFVTFSCQRSESL